MPLTLPPVLADRFTRIIAMLCEIVTTQGMRQRRDGRLTILIYIYVRQVARRFLDRATAPELSGGAAGRPCDPVM